MIEELERMADIYTITTITPTRRFEPGKPNVAAYEVAFATVPNGIQGAVLIDADTFGKETVDAAVRALAQTLEAVKAL